MCRTLALVAVAPLLAGAHPRPAATRELPAAVTQEVALLARNGHLPGIVAGAVPLDGPVSLVAFGARDETHSVPLSASDLFHLGSAVKPMTADLVAMLVAEHRTRWDATLRELVPELLPPGGGAFAAATLRQALAHEAGLPALTDLTDAEWARLRALPGTPTEQRAAVLREVLAGPAAGPRGQRLYSNAGYILAGYVAEKLAREPFERLRRERLLVPLGMDACREGWPRATPDAAEPLGHEPTFTDHGLPTPVRDPHPIGAFLAPAGDLSCPADAVATFLRWHLRALAGERTRPRLPELAVLHALGSDATPLGWAHQRAEDGSDTYAVLGSVELFSALIVLDATHHVGYFALTNVGESPQVKPMLIGIVRAIRGGTTTTAPAGAPHAGASAPASSGGGTGATSTRSRPPRFAA